MDVGLKHEIVETREAERHKFGHGGTLALVSSVRVTAPKTRSCSVWSSRHASLYFLFDISWPLLDLFWTWVRKRSGLDLLWIIWVVSDIPARLRERRKNRSLNSGSLLDSIVTVLNNSRSVSSDATKVSFAPGEAQTGELVEHSRLESVDLSVHSQGAMSTFSESCRKNLAQLPHRVDQSHDCTVILVLCNRRCVSCHDPVFHEFLSRDSLHKICSQRGQA